MQFWNDFAAKHPAAAKWVREGGLFVIVSNLVTVFKYLLLQFLPAAFSSLPETVVKQNLATVTAINRDAVQSTRRQALADAEGISYLYFLSDALGPRLGNAFLTAYDQGALGKAAALIKASEVSTGEAKKHYNNPRPFLVQGNTIHLVPDDVVVKDNQPYTADGGSFPSGHTNTGYTDALLLAAETAVPGHCSPTAPPV